MNFDLMPHPEEMATSSISLHSVSGVTYMLFSGMEVGERSREACASGEIFCSKSDF